MEKISTVRDLISLWPSRVEFAEDLGVPVDRVHKWIPSNAVPVKYHRRILDIAAVRNLTVRAEELIDIHAECQESSAS